VSLKRNRQDTTVEEVSTSKAQSLDDISTSKAQSLDDIVVPITCVLYYMCTRSCPQLAHADYIKTISTFCPDGKQYHKIVCCLCGHCHSDCDSTFVVSLSINALTEELTEFLCLILGADRTDWYDFDCLDIDMRQLQPFLKYIDCKDEVLLYEEAFVQYERISVTTRASCHGTPPYSILKRVAGNFQEGSVHEGYSVHDCPSDLHCKMMNHIIGDGGRETWCSHRTKNVDLIIQCGGKHGIVELLQMLRSLNGVVQGAFAAAVAQKDKENAREMLLPSDMIEVTIFRKLSFLHNWCTLLRDWAKQYHYHPFVDQSKSYVFLHEDSRPVRITYRDRKENLITDINYFCVTLKSCRSIKFNMNALDDWTNRSLTFRSNASSRPYLAFLLDLYARSHHDNGVLKKSYSTKPNPHDGELEKFLTTQQIATSSNQLRHHYPLLSAGIMLKEYGLRYVYYDFIKEPDVDYYHNQVNYLTSRNPKEYTFQKEIHLYPLKENRVRFDETIVSVSFTGMLVKMSHDNIQFHVDDEELYQGFIEALQTGDTRSREKILTAGLTYKTLFFLNGSRTCTDRMVRRLRKYKGQVHVAIKHRCEESEIYLQFEAAYVHVEMKYDLLKLEE
jgi:hypothetical protein